MDASLNFVALVETNPITRLSSNYNNKFLNKIKESFTETQQQLFVSSFYCYLNHHPTNDFVIDLDNVWEWLGFSQKAMAKRSLEKHFVLDKDYKVLLCQPADQTNEGRGGHNKQTILLNIKTFKMFCIKADTKKANDIHEYFIKLEEMLQEIVQEESNELRLQLERKIEETQSLENKLIQAQEILQLKEKHPYIYIYNTDIRLTKPELKIGYSDNVNERINKFKTNQKHGKLEFHIEVLDLNIKTVEHFIHHVLKKYRVDGEVFCINVDEAKVIVMRIVNMFKLVNISDESERQVKLLKLYESETAIIENTPIQKISTREISTQTDEIDPTIPRNEVLSSFVHGNQEMISKFDAFINEHCIVRPDVEISAKDIVGQYRIHIHAAKKEITTAFTEYLKQRFVYGRLAQQDKDQVVMGFTGVKLKQIEYKKGLVPNDAETFIFEKCVFTPSGTTLYKDLLEEYKDWKRIMKMPSDDKEDDDKLKKYLKSCPYLLFETVWASGGGGQGYYGIRLKREVKYQRKSSTGCEVLKKDANNQVLCRFDTIAKAAETEAICAAKMSRSIKNKTMFGMGDQKYFYEKA
jgi:phage anti-repressor protein